MTVHTTDRPRSTWRTMNITTPERIGRVLLGAAAVTAGIVLLISAGSVLAVVLELLLVATGADLAVIGALGHCPLYAKLGRTSISPSRRRP